MDQIRSGRVRHPAKIKIRALLVYGSVFCVAPRVTYNKYAPLGTPWHALKTKPYPAQFPYFNHFRVPDQYIIQHLQQARKQSMEQPRFRRFAGHAARYGIVGIIGTLLHLGILALLVERFQVDPVWSSVIGFFAALITSYILNFFWVFNSRRAHHVAVMRYLLVSFTGLALNTSIMYTVVDVLHWWYGWGALGVIMVVPASNFLLNYLWTFGVHQEVPAQSNRG